MTIAISMRYAVQWGWFPTLLLTGALLRAAETPVPVPASAAITNGPARIGWRASQLVQQAPTQIFRELLAMSPTAREEALATKPALFRNHLKSKLLEYESLSREEREVRLRMVELRWHLAALLPLAPGERPARLALVPEPDRALVAERLMEWDTVAAGAQQELLENQFVLDYFSRMDGRPVEQQKSVLDSLTPERRALLERGFERWNALPSDQRARSHENFKRFFDLGEREQERIVTLLPPATRNEIQSTLDALGNLPADQRLQCLNALRTFTAMTPPQRDEFLRNAERWKAMSPDERDNWRNLVRRIPPMPPLPPGLVPPAASAGVLPRRLPTVQSGNGK